MSDLTPQPVSEEAQVAKEVLEEILRQMEFPGTTEVTTDESRDQVTLSISSDQPLGLLIGKGGQTLNALEFTVSLIAQRRLHERIKRIVVDAEGYRQRQTDRLGDMGREAARKVLETGEPVALEPMNSRDRRTVHMAVMEVEGVATFSVGEDPYRHIVVCLPGQEQQAEAQGE